MPTLLARARSWPGIAAVILISIIMLLPPAAGYARQYAFAQALQFVIFAVVGPALLVLSAPRRIRSPGQNGRPGRPGARAAIVLATFIAAAITWRLPATVNALARDPALAAAEMITLLAAGTGIWLELAGAPPGPGLLPGRPAPRWQRRPCGRSGCSPTSPGCPARPGSPPITTARPAA